MQTDARLCRRPVLQMGLLLCAMGVASAACNRSASDPADDGFAGAPSAAPNILFILADDLRWDALGSYGNRIVRTPNLDRLAAQGARFENFQVASPVCSPSRANFLTGLYTHEPGIVFYERRSRFERPTIAPGTPTVATHLNRAGYVTGFVGKAHLGGDPRHWGFDETPVYQPGFAFGEPPERHKVLFVDGARQPLPRDTTPRFADAAIEFLGTHRAEPWFLWLAFSAPHSPYDQHAAFPYPEDALRPPPGYPPDEPLLGRSTWSGYYSEISALDAQVGRVLDRLETLGIAEHTLVVFTSDNGIMLGSHGIREKSIWYEESNRVPALVRWPARVAPGQSLAGPVSAVDLLPTLLDITGLEPTPSLQGVSFLPMFDGGDPVRQVTFSEAHREKALGGGSWSMVRGQRYKLVSIRGTDEMHFYDLAEDPHETQDLMGAAERAPEINRLRKRLLDWEAPRN
jgi:arylsulfatase A-like enzyme